MPLPVLGEADEIRAKGHDVIIVTYHLGRDVKNHKILRILNIPWYKKTEAGGSWHKLYLDILIFFRCLHAYRVYRPDLIHGHLHEGALIGWFVSMCCSAGKTPVIFDVQGSLSGELESYGLVGKNGIIRKLFGGIIKTFQSLINELELHTLRVQGEDQRNLKSV